MSMRRSTIPMAALLGLAACAGQEPAAPVDNGPETGTEVGKTAPTFTLQDTAGASISLKSFRGKVVLVDFWGTWCGPCVAELPNMKALREKNRGKDLVIVSVAVEQSPEAWRRMIREERLDWTHVIDPNDMVAVSYDVIGVPSTFLLDRSGVIVAKNLRGSALADRIAEILP